MSTLRRSALFGTQRRGGVERRRSAAPRAALPVHKTKMGVSKFHAWLVEQFGSAAAYSADREGAGGGPRGRGHDFCGSERGAALQERARSCEESSGAGGVHLRPSKTTTARAVCRARTSVGFFLDGPLPRAKVVTVRQRRLKAKDGVRADGLEHGTRGLEGRRRTASPPFDVLEISPGTDFSERLAVEGARAVGREENKAQRGRAPGLRRSGCVRRERAGRRRGQVRRVPRCLCAGGGAVRDPRPRDVVLYGGDVDLVVMALCVERNRARGPSSARTSVLF